MHDRKGEGPPLIGTLPPGIAFPAMETSRIAWIGTGVMGRSMAGHLLASGHAVVVHTRTPERAAALLECEHRLAVVPGATHLFEEPGTLEEAARLAAEWFAKHLHMQA